MSGPPGNDDDKRKLGLADTLGEHSKLTDVDTERVPSQSSATLDKKTVTFPPVAWEREDSVISSATTRPALDDDSIQSPRSVFHGERLSEARAREILNARFSAAGAALEADYTFREADLVVTLDGFDPKRRLGYSYISHADVDVVTDFDEATELAFDQFAAAQKAYVLIVHDSDVPTPDALERRIDAFFQQLQRSTVETERF